MDMLLRKQEVLHASAWVSSSLFDWAQAITHLYFLFLSKFDLKTIFDFLNWAKLTIFGLQELLLGLVLMLIHMLWPF